MDAHHSCNSAQLTQLPPRPMPVSTTTALPIALPVEKQLQHFQQV